jgi:type I restriction enzyme S subunit
MATEWKMARLGDVANINQDAIDGKCSYSHIRYIDISSVGEGHLLNQPEWMSLADAPSRAKRLLRKGDTVLSTVRPNRRSMFFASEPGLDWVVSTGFAVLRPNTAEIAPRFLYACVFGHSFTEYLISREKGGAYPAIAPKDIADAEIPLPPLPEQRAIADLLGALDDKIEINRQMNETLEAIARLFFKDWFVDFGPTRAKAEGRPPYLAPELWSLFPDALDDDDKPMGWEKKPLSAVIEPIGGGTPKTSVAEYWNGSIPWFSVVDAPAPSDVFVIKTEKTITPSGLENSSTRLIPRDATIITARGTVGKLALVGIEMAMNQSCYAMTGRAGWSNYFTHFLLKNAVQTLQANAHGSVFDTITRATFDTVSSYCPTQNIAVAFDQTIRDLMEQIRSNLFENNTLAQLRDLLLPKLMSGEIRLSEAEQLVEMVCDV